MTSRDRIARMYEHKEADRVPIIDTAWKGTVNRWKREGMPSDMYWEDYFGTDRLGWIDADISPRFPYNIIEETDRYIIYTSSFGVTMKQLKEEDSTPEFIDFTYNTPEAWEDAKKLMTPTPDRIDWNSLKNEYPKWQRDGRWIVAGFWFGFDVAHSWMTGTETLLIAMLEQPEWVMDIFDTYLNQCIALFDMVWDAGYRFDEIQWPDDMGYKGTTFFSVDTYREMLKPFHKRAVDWAHAKGIKARLHSCGDVMTLIPDITEIGIDALNPLEVKAGMDVLGIKRDYGDRLVLHGGVNAMLWDKPDKIIAEIEYLVPRLKQNGGYIFSSDHSIPNCVSLEDFQRIVAAVKEYGRY